MSSVQVRAGLGDFQLSSGQVLILGRSSDLAQLSFAKLQNKFCGKISEESFQCGQQKLQTESTVPLFLNDCQFLGLSGKYTRNSCPAQPQIVSKLVRSAVSASSKTISIVTVVPYENVIPTVCAIGRVFPLYSRKTKVPGDQSVMIEVVPSDAKELEKSDVAFLNSLVAAVRKSARLVDAPCSELNTDAFVAEAQAVVASLNNPHVKINVIRGEELREQGFGGIYSVGRAATYPPSLVVLSYIHPDSASNYALVGKGIVYDTGGMQIKTKTGMPGMKRDMGGAAAVLSAFEAAVQCGFKRNLHALLCLAENNIGAIATKPDDIITMLSGKTVEVNNTDAEGRLVLGDGVFYAQSVLKADVIIDMATLTGAQAIATGQQHAAVVTNDDEMERWAIQAGKASGDLTHPLPFAPDLHFEILASAVADMKNSGLGKNDAASAVASLFIAAQIEFGQSVKWLHVDMAGPVHAGERATGYGPAFFLTFLRKHLDIPLLNVMG